MRSGMRTIAALLALTLLGGCAPKSVTAGGEDDGATFSLAQGGELTLELPSNPSTGYGWQLVEPSLGGVLEAGGTSEFVGESALAGAPGVERFRFKAVKAGTTTLRLEYRRPWETTATPEKTYGVTISVR